jgi:formylglycine-generating enzyme required for sulfatase activity
MSTTPTGSQIIVPPENSPGGAIKPKGNGKSGIIIVGVLVLLLAAGFFWYWNQTVNLRLTLNPADATVVLDGKTVVPESDGNLQVKRGKHRLEVVSPGYTSYEETFSIGLSGSQNFDVTLQVQPGLLSVITDPEEATVSISGEIKGTTPLNGLELPPGGYEIAINKENYLPYSEHVTIEGRRQRSRIETTLTPAWSRVSLNTSPEGANLLVNNQEVGNTPVAMDLLLGSYDLRLEMPDREPQEFTIRVPANQTIDLPTRAMAWKHGSLFLGTTPPGAWVTVDGEIQGQTPGTFSIPSKKEVGIKVALFDHEEVVFDLDLQPGEATEQRLDLKPLTGTIRIETVPTKAEVFLDGRIKGLTPLALELTIQDHAFEIRKAGYLAQSHKLRPLANKTARHSFTLIGEQQGNRLTDDQIVRALIAQKDNIQKEVSTPSGNKLKLIQPDSYTMGLPENSPDKEFNEIAVRMRIRQPFYFGLYEVSNREFKVFKADHDSGIINGVSLQSGDRPVTGVTWRDAVEYCNWLSDIQGLKPAYLEIEGNFVLIEPRTDGYRLPTEAEWEYVARHQAGSTSMIYPWGMDTQPLDKSGNYAGEEAKVINGQFIKGYRDGYRATAPVGSYNPNSEGIFDMGGNVAEWCTDYYSYTYPSSPRPLVDYAGPEQGDQRVIRGSGWRSALAKELRSTAKRYGLDAADDVGFRLVRSYPIIIE